MRFFALLLASGFLILSVACGGSGNSPAAPAQEQGRVRVIIKWPVRGRTIPQATNSITITAVELIPNEDGEGFTEDQELNVKIVPRPEGDDTISITVLDLPSIKVRLKARAFENGLGTGTVIASGTTDVDVTTNGNANATISMAVAITQITVTPPSITGAPNDSVELVATAKDADGNTVVVPSTAWTWSSTNSAVAQVTQQDAPNGDKADVDILTAGSATIRATHSPSGHFKDVLVSQPSVVTITPNSTALQPGGTKQFTATASGNPGAQFTWSATGGTINPTTGFYTAGNADGNFTVTATVVGDSTKFGTATITIGPVPPLLATRFFGTVTTNVEPNPSAANVFINAPSGAIFGSLFLTGGGVHVFPIDSVTDTSFTSGQPTGDTFIHVQGEVSVDGNTVTLNMTHTQKFGSGFVQVITFVGTRPLVPPAIPK